MTRLSAILLAGVACAVSSPAIAQTQCVQFELIGNGAEAEYHPFEANSTTEVFDLRARRLADGVYGVRFVLADRTPKPSGPGLGALGPLFYDISWLQDSTRRVFVVGNEQPQPLTSAELNFPGNSGVELTRFRLLVPAGQQASAQRHRDELVIRYQCLDRRGNPIGATQEQPASIPIAVRVPRYAAAYVGSLGQTRGSISFGEVSSSSASLTKAIGITALSTMPFEISVDSENGGKLKRRRTDEDGVAYAMRYGNVPVADGDTLLCPMTPAPMGQAEQFEVTLNRDSLAGQPAGTYSDTVTLTFQPRDVVALPTCAVR